MSGTSICRTDHFSVHITVSDVPIPIIRNAIGEYFVESRLDTPASYKAESSEIVNGEVERQSWPVTPYQMVITRTTIPNESCYFDIKVDGVKVKSCTIEAGMVRKISGFRDKGQVKEFLFSLPRFAKSETDKLPNERHNHVGLIEIECYEAVYVSDAHHSRKALQYKQASKKDTSNITGGNYTMSTTKVGRVLYTKDTTRKVHIWRKTNLLSRVSVRYHMGHTLREMGLEVPEYPWIPSLMDEVEMSRSRPSILRIRRDFSGSGDAGTRTVVKREVDKEPPLIDLTKSDDESANSDVEVICTKRMKKETVELAGDSDNENEAVGRSRDHVPERLGSLDDSMGVDDVEIALPDDDPSTTNGRPDLSSRVVEITSGSQPVEIADDDDDADDSLDEDEDEDDNAIVIEPMDVDKDVAMETTSRDPESSKVINLDDQQDDDFLDLLSDNLDQNAKPSENVVDVDMLISTSEDQSSGRNSKTVEDQSETRDRPAVEAHDVFDLLNSESAPANEKPADEVVQKNAEKSSVEVEKPDDPDDDALLLDDDNDQCSGLVIADVASVADTGKSGEKETPADTNSNKAEENNKADVANDMTSCDVIDESANQTASEVNVEVQEAAPPSDNVVEPLSNQKACETDHVTQSSNDDEENLTEQTNDETIENDGTADEFDEISKNGSENTTNPELEKNDIPKNISTNQNDEDNMTSLAESLLDTPDLETKSVNSPSHVDLPEEELLQSPDKFKA